MRFPASHAFILNGLDPRGWLRKGHCVVRWAQQRFGVHAVPTAAGGDGFPSSLAATALLAWR